MTKRTVDDETLEIREVTYEDRRFQTLWDGSSFDVKLINWPATKGDSRVTLYVTHTEFEQAKLCLDADILGIVLPQPARTGHSLTAIQETQRDLDEFLTSVPPDTHVLIVHKGVDEKGVPLKAQHSLYATFLVNECQFETHQNSFWELIGGAMYVLAGVPRPTGVKKPAWQFITELEQDCEQPFPLHTKTDDVDWAEVIHRLVDSKNNAGITLLLQRFISLVSVSFKKQLWQDLEFNSSCLVQLRGNPFEFWMMILALEQQGKLEELQPVVEQLENKYPEIYLTSIALCLLQLDEDKRKDYLLRVDISTLGVHHALGLFGRLCLKAGLEEQGREAIALAIKKGVALFPDRAQLAKHYYENEQFEDAWRILGRVGLSSGELSWQVLRLKILTELNDEEQVVIQANRILHQNPGNEVALNAIDKYT